MSPFFCELSSFQSRTALAPPHVRKTCRNPVPQCPMIWSPVCLAVLTVRPKPTMLTRHGTAGLMPSARGVFRPIEMLTGLLGNRSVEHAWKLAHECRFVGSDVSNNIHVGRSRS